MKTEKEYDWSDLQIYPGDKVAKQIEAYEAKFTALIKELEANLEEEQVCYVLGLFTGTIENKMEYLIN